MLGPHYEFRHGSGISYERFMQLAMNTQGSSSWTWGRCWTAMKPWQRDLLIRSAACDAMDCLDKMIATEKNKQRAKPRKGKITLKRHLPFT